MNGKNGQVLIFDVPFLSCQFMGVLSLWLLLASCGTANSQVDNIGYYNNPIIEYSTPDPTVIRAADGNFYLYGTENTHNIPIYQSEDLVHWAFIGTVFTDETRPVWEGPHRLWAPEIRYINGQYVLYYSWAIWADEWHSHVGVATANSPKGPFIDHGCLINAQETGVRNSIDQFFYREGDDNYMFWGSFSGIYVTQLSDDGLSLKTDDAGSPILKKQVCGDAFEATNIYKRGNYYYLFASVGSCCEGVKSTYKVVVGRSENILGPYVNSEGKDMLDNYYDVVLHGNAIWVGPGHNAILVVDDMGVEWMIYHAFSAQNEEQGRQVLLDRLYWTEDGWPYIKDAEPSSTFEQPVFVTYNKGK